MSDLAELPRRRPGCGNEFAHPQHAYTQDCWPDGRPLGDRDGGVAMCAGWTAAEAGLCVMLRAVHETMAAKAPLYPRGIRLECSWSVPAGLAAMVLAAPQSHVDELYGAELVIMAGLPAGGWRLVPVPEPLITGTVPVITV